MLQALLEQSNEHSVTVGELRNLLRISLTYFACLYKSYRGTGAFQSAVSSSSSNTDATRHDKRRSVAERSGHHLAALPLTELPVDGHDMDHP